jgi:hypothetical protein
MAKNEAITIYWAPSKFTTEQQSWNMLYSEPRSLLTSLHLNNKHKGGIVKCPAVKNMFKNIYSFDSTVTDSFSLDPKVLSSIAYTETEREFIPTDSKLYIEKSRKSSIDNFINISYNMGWIFFASEPVTARMSAPYFPTAEPVEGAMLAAGEFDIGRWFRPFVLDYHIPVSSKKFTVKKDQPLFFLELKTDKKVIFQRFELTKKLDGYLNEAVGAPANYQRRLSLLERYKMAHGASIPKMILNEIRKNLVS